MYNNQICRMDWCVKAFKDANHHPIAAINGDQSDTILRVNASAGQELNLDASASTDPDNDNLTYHWWIYKEAGTYAGDIHLPSADAPSIDLKIPTGAAESQIHLILEVQDQDAVPLFDYRRIVIDIDNRIIGHKPVQK